MELMAYQREVVDRYVRAFEEDGQDYCPLFACMGSGKSAMSLSIALALYERSFIDRVLVIAPNRVHTQWALEEVPKWVRVPHYVTHHKLTRAFEPIPGVLNIVAINVDTFSHASASLPYLSSFNSPTSMIILDEATSIKNYQIRGGPRRASAIVGGFKNARYRLAATGTPTTNTPLDLWAIYEFLRPGYFGMNRYVFQHRYAMYVRVHVGSRDVDTLLSEKVWSAIRSMPYTLAQAQWGIDIPTYEMIMSQHTWEGPFRNVEDLRKKVARTATFIKLTSLPPVTHETSYISLSPAQEKAYKDMEKNLLYEASEGAYTDAASKVTAYIRLQQISSGFISRTDEEAYGDIIWLDPIPPKMQALLDDIPSLIDDSSLIIITRFVAEARKIASLLHAYGFDSALAIGGEKGWDTKFKNGEVPILVANETVIAKGFNLQDNCCRMVFYSNTFSLEDRLQTEARIHRTGQSRPCYYKDYINSNTIDMKITNALLQKQALGEYIANKSIEEFIASYRS